MTVWLPLGTHAHILLTAKNFLCSILNQSLVLKQVTYRCVTFSNVCFHSVSCHLFPLFILVHFQLTSSFHTDCSFHSSACVASLLFYQSTNRRIDFFPNGDLSARVRPHQHHRLTWQLSQTVCRRKMCCIFFYFTSLACVFQISRLLVHLLAFSTWSAITQNWPLIWVHDRPD